MIPPPSHPEYASILEIVGMTTKKNEEKARVDVFKKLVISSPFSLEILAEDVLEKLKQLRLAKFDGS